MNLQPAGIRAGDGTSGYPADWTMFLPAAGGRSTGGSVSTQGTYGYYWSSTARSSTNGYSLGFYSTYVGPSGNSNYASGFGVRCVRDVE